MKRLFTVLLSLILVSFFPSVSHAKGKAPIRVACIGNSITYGYLLKDRERVAYPVVLQTLLGTKYEVANFGKSGATLLFRGHRPYIEQEEYRQALVYKADIAVIHLGVNDTDPRNWPNYRDVFIPNYRQLIDSLRHTNPRMRILIARTTPIGVEHPRFESGTRDWQRQIQRAIECVARGAGVQLIDLHAPLYPYPHYLPDAVHPTAEGAKILAEVVYSAITGNYGGLRLPSVYSSGMVLQRGAPLQLSGTANAGEHVKVTLQGQKVNPRRGLTFLTTAKDDGSWWLSIPSPEAGGPYTLTFQAKSRTIQLDSVYIGEVWLCSGQSNMAMQLRETKDRDLAQQANDPELRIYDMKPAHVTDAVTWPVSFLDSLNRLDYYLPTQWQAATPHSVASTSAIAYHFAKELRDSLKVPVGIIVNAVGGAPTEAWIDRETLERNLPAILRHWRTNDYIMPWVRERATQNLKLQDTPLARHPYAPTYLFDIGIRPLAHYGLRGVLWYQGESNAHNVEAHEQLFPLLTSSWKNYFGSNLSFYYVQLSSINRPTWPHFRDSQRRMQQPKNGVEMVVSSDLGHPNDVHPKNKKPIGHRLALLALHNDYGFDTLTARSPSLSWVGRVKTDEGEVLGLSFKDVRTLTTSDHQPIRGFELVDADGLIHPVTAEAFGNVVRIPIPKSIRSQRLTIRYGWKPFTDANLVGDTGLPVSTFMTREDELL